MPVAECGHPHIAETYEPFAGTVDKVVAVSRMELGGCNDFSELFHVGWFDVNYIETLIRYVQMP